MDNRDIIAPLSNAIKDWLKPDNTTLKKAIDRTVDESLFSFEDVKHRILSLRESLNTESLQQWAEISGLIQNSACGKSILCLHAGNLPMVGIQDLLAVIMTGGRYVGKFSKKDPYLLETLIDKLKEHRIGADYQYEINIDKLSGISADAVLFSGSKSSVEVVKHKLSSLGITNQVTPLLIRTAHFSVAWIHDQYPTTMERLIDAILRYGGKGCRSVAVVVAPFSITSNRCNITDYFESFWAKYPQNEKPPKSLYHHYAMNKAVGISQVWLDDFLVEEELRIPDKKFVLQWVEGGEEELRKIVKMSKGGLQSIYSTDRYIDTEIDNRVIEPLDKAQNPPIWWRPDNINSIVWLQNQFVSET